MTGFGKSRDSSQPVRSSIRLRQVQNTALDIDELDQPMSSPEPLNTRIAATRGKTGKDTTLKFSPVVDRKRRDMTPEIDELPIKTMRTTTPEVIELIQEILESQPKERSPKKPRRSTRDIRRPKFDDEIVPAPSISAKERKKKPSSRNSVTDTGGKVKRSKSSTDVESTLEDIQRALTNDLIDNIVPKTIEQIEEKTEMLSPPVVPLTTQNDIASNLQPVCQLSQNTVSISFTTSTSSSSSLQTQKKARPSRSKTQKAAAQQNRLSYPNPIYCGVVNDIVNRWVVEDDILLMGSVQHLCDLPTVLAQSKFTQKYSLNDLDERWYLMMYDRQISKIVKERVAQQTKNFVSEVYRKIPFSADEEKLLLGLDPTSNPPTHIFKRLLKNKIFPVWRTSEDLCTHYHKLQSISTKKKENKSSSVSLIHEDIEQNLDFINLAQKDVPTDADAPTVPRDLSKAEDSYQENRKAPHDAIAGSTLSPQMPSNAFAQLRGRVVAFNILKPFVVIGRSTDEVPVDINLLNEGPCNRTNKVQAVIKLDEANDLFLLFNVGTNPIFVEDHVLYTGQKWILKSNTKIAFGILDMLFLRNESKRTCTPISDGISESQTDRTKSTTEVSRLPATATTTLTPAKPMSQHIPITNHKPAAPSPKSTLYQMKDETNKGLTTVISNAPSRKRLDSFPPVFHMMRKPKQVPVYNAESSKSLLERPGVIEQLSRCIETDKRIFGIERLAEIERARRNQLNKGSNSKTLNQVIQRPIDVSQTFSKTTLSMQNQETL